MLDHTHKALLTVLSTISDLLLAPVLMGSALPIAKLGKGELLHRFLRGGAQGLGYLSLLGLELGCMFARDPCNRGSIASRMSCMSWAKTQSASFVWIWVTVMHRHANGHLGIVDISARCGLESGHWALPMDI